MVTIADNRHKNLVILVSKMHFTINAAQYLYRRHIYVFVSI